MEWIETTGKSIEEAKEAALDELGVDEQDAEFEVIAEPKAGLFGRVRGEARVRSRVRPTAPRPKEERRGRRKPRSTERASGSTEQGGDASAFAESGAGSILTEEAPVSAPAAEPTARTNGDGWRSGGEGRAPRRSAEDRNEEREHKVTNVDVPLEEQSQVAQEFLAGLVQEFGLTADIVATVGDEDVIDISVTGSDLGMLIGPKGSTLLALQDLTRSAVQQKTSAGNGRIHVDVSGYRQKRSEALARFAVQVADKVKESGARQALEPMSAVDRKVVHDALTDVDGVSTISEGEDAQRRVVIVPASA